MYKRQVNNRNLKDFTVDTANSKKLRDRIPDDIIFVSESGVKSTDDIDVYKRQCKDTCEHWTVQHKARIVAAQAAEKP